MFPFHPQGHCQLAASSRPGSVPKPPCRPAEGEHQQWERPGGGAGAVSGKDTAGQGTWLTEKGPAFPSGVT